MEDKLFDINNFNIIQDEENYYFFRALNMADNADISVNYGRGSYKDRYVMIKRKCVKNRLERCCSKGKAKLYNGKSTVYRCKINE